MIGINGFTTLTFDCYGTLIDWERGIFAELRPWADRHGRQDLDDNCSSRHSVRPRPPARSKPPACSIRKSSKKCTVDWLGGGASDRPGRGCELRSIGPSLAAFDDSAAALRYLKRYYKLVIISNVDRASFSRSNEKLGVEFDRVITAQDVGSYKPDIRNFDYALADLKQSLGVGKDEILHTAQISSMTSSPPNRWA